MATGEYSSLFAVAVGKFLGEWVFFSPVDSIICGWYNDQNTNRGGGFIFLNVAIPQGSTINIAYITFTSAMPDDETIVRSKIVGEATDDADLLSNLADYQARRGTEAGGANNDNRTVAEVLWDGIGTWENGVDYNSPEIKTVIQEIVDRDGWVSGNRMAIWWDDHAGRSSTTELWTIRVTESHPKLHIDYTPPPAEKRYFAWII